MSGAASQRTGEAPTASYRVVVIELDDLLPRLETGLPNLVVVTTVLDPDARLERLNRVDGSPRWAAGHGRCVRHDLSIGRTYGSLARAKKAAGRRVERLLRAGYVVNGRNSQRRVYVIELDAGHLTDPGAGYFYVGETSRHPEVRFEQHRTGARSRQGFRLQARGIGPHVRRLRPDLAPVGFYLTKAESEAAEAATRLELEARGCVVRGGHTATNGTPDK